MANKVGADGSRWSLQGMTALVTGGTKSLGRAIVEELAAFGARVHTCARNEAQLNECLREWEAKAFQISGFFCNASPRSQRHKLMDTVSSLFHSKLNILVGLQSLAGSLNTLIFSSLVSLCVCSFSICVLKEPGCVLPPPIASISSTSPPTS